MNVFLWILQVLLAVHTAIGAVWKFSNSEQTVPALGAIPHGIWLGMGAFELVCSAGLVLPAVYRPAAVTAPIAAAFIAAEMLFFTALQIQSGDMNYGHVIYWLVVAAICLFLAYGRFVLKRIQ